MKNTYDPPWIQLLFLPLLFMLSLLAAFPAQAQEAKLTASDGTASDKFGSSVALSEDGSLALVGAHWDDVNDNSYQGSAYVFVRNAEGDWVQQAKLTASDGVAGDFFGESVALIADGSLALVGADRDNEDEGSAYVFARNAEGDWVQQAKLIASDGASDDHFGSSVALSTDGSFALVGALGSDVGENANQGSAYVFARQSGGNYAQQAKLIASDGEGYDGFGEAVSLSADGDRALVGASRLVGEIEEQVRAHVFDRQEDGNYVQQATFAVLNGTDNDQYTPTSVALSADGTSALIGAERDSGPIGEGSAYVFTRQEDGNYAQQTLFTTSGTGIGASSLALSADGSRALVADLFQREEGGYENGAYVFARQEDGSYTQQTLLTASGTGISSAAALSADGSLALVGSPYDEVNGTPNQGSAYVFDLGEEEDLELIGLEVNQAIQDWQNSVPLIRGKDTYVRAFVQSTDTGSVLTRGLVLRGFRGGGELPESPLYPYPPGDLNFTAPPQAESEQEITQRRRRWDQSLNFHLPEEWTGLGSAYTLKVESQDMEAPEIDCKEAVATPDDCSVEVSFVEVAKPDIKFFRVRSPQSSQYRLPTNDNIRDLIKRLIAIFPISNVTASTYRENYPIHNYQGPPIDLPWVDLDLIPDHYWINRGLHRKRRVGECFSDCAAYVGIRAGRTGGVSNVEAFLNFMVASADVPFTRPRDRGRNVHAHEIGHIFGRGSGRGHPPVCDASALLTDENFPYYEEDILYVEQTGEDSVATIGPLGEGQDKEIWGLDTYQLQLKEETGLVGHPDIEPIVDPRKHFELMSYCGSWRWISDYTYEGILGQINAAYGQTLNRNDLALKQNEDRLASKAVSPLAADGQTRPHQQSRQRQSYLLVSGLVDLESDDAAFQPFYTTVPIGQAPPRVPPEEADYSLQLLSASGEVVSEVPFQPFRGYGAPSLTDLGAFDVPVARDSSIREIRVLRSGSVIASRSASPSAPTVEITRRPGSSETTLEWEAVDADGDSLTFVVQRSEDGGVTWETPVLDRTGRSYEFDPAAISDSTGGGRLFRVVASDGFNTGTDVSGSSAPAPDDTPPVCGPINVERNGDGLLTAVQTSASDIETGIASVAFTTLENLDGFAGGNGPFAQGDVYSMPDPNPETVQIRGERVSFSEGGAILTTVTNGAGLTARCDPVVEQIDAAVPERFALRGNAPNPFSEQTTIAFSLAEPVEVTLEVYDVLGRHVRTLLSGEKLEARSYRLEWDGRSRSGQALAPGVYVVRLRAGSFEASRRAVLVR